MLVLRRKLGQSITVGDPASSLPPTEITILAVRGEIVELGINGPAGVKAEKSGAVSGRARRKPNSYETRTPETRIPETRTPSPQ